MAIKFEQDNSSLNLIYMPESMDWLNHKLKEDGNVRIRKTFNFVSEDILEKDEFSVKFKLANLEEEYYKIPNKKLGIEHNVSIHKEINISRKTFIAIRDISIFKKLDKIIKSDLYIGGETGNLSEEMFNQLLEEFPTTSEVNLYALSRISRVIQENLDLKTDYYKKLIANINKRTSTKRKDDFDFIRKEIEIEKFDFVYSKLIDLLNQSESISEKEWQDNIIEIILLIFPKYIKRLTNVYIKDFYSNPNKTTPRYIDIALIDFNGNIDIIEVKKPFANCILGKSTYRNNYIPHKELNGSLMQVEKYLYHLSKWGRNGEMELSKKYQTELPNNLTIKITNPKALVILGRDDNFSDPQKLDFEVIRRKHNNIIDILTYDDLLRRIKNIIDTLKIVP